MKRSKSSFTVGARRAALFSALGSLPLRTSANQSWAMALALSDGRRQIGAFHLAGEIFGLKAGEEHRFTAEALAGATVLAFRRTYLDLSAHDSEALREEVLASAIRNLDRAQEQMLLLGRKTAQEKVAAFLLDMADRVPDGEGQFELPMQRSDIADYLGLTIETVSRTLSQFTRDGLIWLPAGQPMDRTLQSAGSTAAQHLKVLDEALIQRVHWAASGRWP